jgi:hypothetical protein
MQQALDALVEIHPGNMTPMAEESWNKAIEALRARLAQPLPEKSKGALSHEENKRHNKKILDKFYEENAHLYKAQPEQEPVAWIYSHKGQKIVSMNYVAGVRAIPLYTAPPQREWKGLTDEEMRCFVDDFLSPEKSAREVFNAIEAKLKEKNSG